MAQQAGLGLLHSALRTALGCPLQEPLTVVGPLSWAARPAHRDASSLQTPGRVAGGAGLSWCLSRWPGTHYPPVGRAVRGGLWGTAVGRGRGKALLSPGNPS